MKILSATFEAGAKDLGSSPDWSYPEFAFIGRSNVGKSSLINMLTNRDALAKVSSTPGKTRMINFFLINRRWSLVDLPGYGYAKVSKSEKRDFTEALADYLSRRANLRAVFILIDSRLTPQPIDLDFVSWFARLERPFVLVFTKADKQSATRTKASVDAFLNLLGGEAPRVLTTSSKDRTGRNEMLGWIAGCLQT